MLVEGFRGYLQLVGYTRHARLSNVALGGCWAHARHAFKALLKASCEANVTAKEGMDFFTIERELKDALAEERYNVRLAHSRPVLDAFSSWFDIQSSGVVQKHLGMGYYLLQKAEG